MEVEVKGGMSVSEKKFFCFGKNGFCDNPKGCETGKKCVHINGDGGEYREYHEQNTRLNREAWEPCEFCRERDREVYKTEDYPGICDFEVMLDGPYEITVNAYNHYTPFTEDICFSFPVLFCPKCSRPLTEEAWKMLEKRIGGVNDEKT